MLLHCVLGMWELLASALCLAYQMGSKVEEFYWPSWDLKLSKLNFTRQPCLFWAWEATKAHGRDRAGLPS